MRFPRRTSVFLTLVLGLTAGLVVPVTSASAAATDIVISEIMYDPLSNLDGDEFVEIANRGATPVDLSGWCFGGITLCLAPGTTIAGGGFFVVSPDAARFQSTYGTSANAIYTGSVSNGGETLSIRDAGAVTIDSVTYDDVSPWPVKSDGNGPSLELIDPTLENNDFLNWASSTAPAGHTAKAANSVAASGLGPRITGVAAAPAVPAPNQPVTVTATVTDETSVSLIYRIDFAAEQTVAMTNTGGDTFQASIPGAGAGHLIRYRIQATNGKVSRVPRVDDTIIYQGVVAASGVSSAIPVFEWFIAQADYNAIVSQPTVDISRPAVLAYAGTVYDNVMVNIRGQSTQNSPKPNWKFEMAPGHDLDMPGVLIEPVDEFAMQADFSDHAHGRALLSWDSYITAGVIDAQIFPVRTQRNSAFQGLYSYLDLFDGTWREREGYDDKQFFKATHGAFDPTRPLEENRFEKKNPDDGDFAPLIGFLNGMALTGTAERNYLLANADIPQMINYAAVTAIIAHHDSSSKNFYMSQDPATSRWSIVPWDLDHTYGNGCCSVNSNFVTPAEPGDKTNDLMVALLAVPEWRQMYFRRLKTLVGEVLAPGRLEAVYDAKVGPAQPEATLDFGAWPHGGSRTYANQRTALFNAINARRTVFANDSRVPAAQSAAPPIVINEIQHSPAGGDAAEFLELYNPSATEAVDLSGWSIADGIDLQIQPGTVILPRQTMVFAADDPTFRTTYGATIFLGDTYDGDLAASETLTLLRRDGSTADSVTFGGAGWPVATGGPSLELLNPSSDNNDPANWALSVAPAGTPGAPNQSGGGGGDQVAPNTTITAPAANAVLTNASVTLSGTATDNVDVGGVNLTLQNTSTGAWLQGNGTFGPTQAVVPANLVNDQGATTGWQLPTTLPNGSYALTATAVDASTNADASPATRSFSVSVGGGPDTVAPNGTLTGPTNNQVFTVRMVPMSGGATDNVNVGTVGVAIKRLSTGQWLQPNGTFGTWANIGTTFTSDNGTSVTWSYTTPTLPPGQYRVNVEVFDAAGNKDGTKATALFTVQ